MTPSDIDRSSTPDADGGPKDMRSMLDLAEIHRSAVHHVTDGGKNRRSAGSSEGWAMIHSEYLADLECLAESAQALRFHSTVGANGQETITIAGASQVRLLHLREAVARLRPNNPGPDQRQEESDG